MNYVHVIEMSSKLEETNMLKAVYVAYIYSFIQKITTLSSNDSHPGPDLDKCYSELKHWAANLRGGNILNFIYTALKF